MFEGWASLGRWTTYFNSSRTPREWRNGPLSNAMPALAGLLFLIPCVKQVWDQPWAEFF